jgi:phosphoenolpyruvate carboxylase
MSIVDAIDFLYSIYAIGVFVFSAYFARKLTTPKSKRRAMVKMEKTEKRYLLIVIAILINAITISPLIPSQRWRLRRICWTTYGV